ncbi:MAG: helix-turn-helix domain-containing protein [Hyphomonadaceae bacterium]
MNITQMSQTEAKVTLALREADRALTVRELGARLGLDHTTLYSALHNLRHARVVVREQVRKFSGPKQPTHAWMLA